MVVLQAAIPILIGTKFDDFIQLPIDLQWTIASQVRLYAFNKQNTNSIILLFSILGPSYIYFFRLRETRRYKEKALLMFRNSEST